MRRRIREVVVRIAKTDANRVDSLPLLDRALVPVLSFASLVYSAAVFARRLLYRYGIFRPTRLPVPVLSVGNITWGGNGKTPMVEFLSTCFLRAGICPLILTRGYAGGDEARLLQSHLDGSCAKFGIGPNRAASAKSVLEQHGVMDASERRKRAQLIELCNKEHLTVSEQGGDERVGVVLLDDGMQHWQLTRDLEIVMVNMITVWGNQLMVPRGPLRESFQELKRADIVVLHHADLVSEEMRVRVKDILQQVTRDESLIISSRMAPQYLLRPTASLSVDAPRARHMPDKSWRVVALTAIRDSVVLCVSGVGCPESVWLVLEQMGPHYLERMEYVDHHIFNAKEVDTIWGKYVSLQQKFSQRAILLVLTEKDYIRNPVIWMNMKNVELLILYSSLEVLPIAADVKALAKRLSTSGSCMPRKPAAPCSLWRIFK